MDVVIVGAGTLGASLAWWLARAGEHVTLVDQFEPGDPRSSSGGETRLLRCGHGDATDYTAMARRARELWRELEQESREDLFIECGLVWFADGGDGWEAASEHTLTAQGIPVERLDPGTARHLYPSYADDDIAFVLLEPEAGVLRAQRAVRVLASQAAAHGARAVRGRGRPVGDAVELDDATRLAGDVVVWACGTWPSDLFGDLVPLTVTRQELLFFDGGPGWRARGIPAWCDYDVRERFPALERAPLQDARTCRYELTRDTHFVAEVHPEHPDVWLVGGGSGQGFKHGPAMAERVAAAITAGAALPDRFALGRRAVSRSLRTAGSGIRDR